jgi:FKBP-type peptidyl-prolyl cis-trans isomerase FkpA
MRRLLLVPLLITLACGQSSAPEEEAAPAEGEAAATAPDGFATDDDRALYALGLSIGRSLDMFQLSEADLAKVQAGMADQITGKEPKLVLDENIGKVRDLAKRRAEGAAKAEKDKGAAFLTQLAATAGAKTTSTGLVYIETQAGSGASPKATDTVKVQYKGTLIDGHEFDSSYKRGQPAEFSLGAVVPCWTEAIQLMKPGGKAKIGCPGDIAYGDAGRPPEIPGGATLVFEVELLEIVASG